MTVTAQEALREVGAGHMNDATAAVAVCPRRHELFRVVLTVHGPVYVAHVLAPRLHAAARRALEDGPAKRPSITITELYDKSRTDALAAAGLVGERADRLPASCTCGNWSVPYDYVVALGAESPPRKKGVPRIVVDTTRVRLAL